MGAWPASSSDSILRSMAGIRKNQAQNSISRVVGLLGENQQDRQCPELAGVRPYDVAVRFGLGNQPSTVQGVVSTRCRHFHWPEITALCSADECAGKAVDGVTGGEVWSETRKEGLFHQLVGGFAYVLWCRIPHGDLFGGSGAIPRPLKGSQTSNVNKEFQWKISWSEISSKA
jgi:hypothetical protein